MHVLIVDDNATNLKVLRAVLESADLTVSSAVDGVEALSVLEHEAVDLVVSDILMPRMDGYRLCHEIRHDPRLRDLPFVFYTNTYLNPGDEKVALDLGADKYLRKPVPADVLLKALQDAKSAAARRPASAQFAEADVLKEYSERLVRKLEEKNVELEQAKGDLQRAYDDLQRTQQAIIQQERLRALGQMAGGVAHDINNAISPAALYVESLLEREPELSDQARERLVSVQRAIYDVAQTVTRLKEFCRPGEPQKDFVRVDLNRLVLEVKSLTRARWRDLPQQQGVVIDFQTDLAPQLPELLASEGELRDALTNLVFNAVDAMPSGGLLTMRTRRFEECDRQKAVGGSALRLEASDTGIGMDDTTRRRCLEPFFTTKGERGSGLGLAMVYGTVQRHEAAIEIDSEVGRGTTVRLTFPTTTAIVDAATRLANISRSIPPMRPSRGLRLLIVDDDALILASLRDALESDGHCVVSAAGGQMGIELFSAAHEGAEPFAAVITDLGMPYVDGRSVAVAIKALSPATPVILLTGWGQRSPLEGDLPPIGDRVLSKPPKLCELRQTLAELTCDLAPPH